MKKVMEWVVFLAIVAVLPGGILLAVRKLAQRVKAKLVGCFMATMLTAGCTSTFQYQTSEKQWIKGTTMSPETVMMADAEAAVRRAEAKCIEKNGMACYYGGYGYGAPFVEQPWWQPSVAVGSAMQPPPKSLVQKKASVRNKKTTKKAKKVKKGN